MTEMWAALQQIGVELSPRTAEATRALFASRVMEMPHSTVVQRDIAYGEHPRQRLDLVSPARPQAAFLFVHGGGFIAGDKSIKDSPFYSNVGMWAANKGIVAALINYRLAPEAKWPSASEDISRAFRWLQQHLSAKKENQLPIHICGHSAGATHVAQTLCGDAHVARCASGASLISGIYQLEAATPTAGFRAYFGDDLITYPSRSTRESLASLSIPLLVAAAEIEAPGLKDQAAALAAARGGRDCTHLMIQGHSHLSGILHLHTEDDRFGEQLAAFVLTQ